MSSRSVNLSAILGSVLVAISYFVGALSDANAFFLALSIIATYTGYQLTRHDGMPVLEVLKTIFANPSAFPRRRAYFSYVGCVALGSIILVQAVLPGI